MDSEAAAALPLDISPNAKAPHARANASNQKMRRRAACSSLGQIEGHLGRQPSTQSPRNEKTRAINNAARKPKTLGGSECQAGCKRTASPKYNAKANMKAP